MIRIPGTQAELDARAINFYNDLRFLKIKDNLNAWPAASLLKPVMAHLYVHYKDIIVSRPADLENLTGPIEALIATAKNNYALTNPPELMDKNGNQITKSKTVNRILKKWCNDRIKAIFNYDNDGNSFTQKDKGSYAFRHARRLNVNTCPYCNAHFTYTIKNKRGKSRPQFDHYLNKATYPYLALSFYNLVPSCNVCNSTGIKGEKPFSIKTHLHPFINDIDGLFQFRVKISTADFLVNDKDFELQLVPCKGIKKEDKKIAAKTINDFMIQDRYRFHKDIVKDILKKAYVYNAKNVGLLLKELNYSGIKIFKSEAEIKELIFGNYLHPDNFHKRILSKLTKEIAEEFGIKI